MEGQGGTRLLPPLLLLRATPFRRRRPSLPPCLPLGLWGRRLLPCEPRPTCMLTLTPTLTPTLTWDPTPP